MQFGKRFSMFLLLGAMASGAELTAGFWTATSSAVSGVNFDTVKNSVHAVWNSTACKLALAGIVLNTIDDYTGSHIKTGIKRIGNAAYEKTKMLFETRENIATTISSAALLSLFGVKNYSSFGNKIPDIAYKGLSIAGLSTIAGKGTSTLLNHYTLNHQKEEFNMKRQTVSQALQSSSDKKLKESAPVLPEFPSNDANIMKYSALTMAGVMSAWTASEYAVALLNAKK